MFVVPATREAEVAVSQDRATALQPGCLATEQDSVSKKKRVSNANENTWVVRAVAVHGAAGKSDCSDDMIVTVRK